MSDLPLTKRKHEGISDTAVNKHKDAFTITMPIDLEVQDGQEQISSAHSFDGLIWRLHVKKDDERRWMKVYVHCEGDGLTELWRTDAKMKLNFEPKDEDTFREIQVSNVFIIGEQGRNKFLLKIIYIPKNALFKSSISVTIHSKSDSFARRPIIEAKSSINDSGYFSRLFFGNFKESYQKEIEIRDTDPEDFCELITYGISLEPTTVDNATRFLMMAEMFDLQIVKDRMENFLLSTNLVSIHRKILIAEEHKLKILKDNILRLYKNDHGMLRELTRSPEYAEFPGQLAKDLLFLVHG